MPYNSYSQELSVEYNLLTKVRKSNLFAVGGLSKDAIACEFEFQIICAEIQISHFSFKLGAR